MFLIIFMVSCLDLHCLFSGVRNIGVWQGIAVWLLPWLLPSLPREVISETKCSHDYCFYHTRWASDIFTLRAYTLASSNKWGKYKYNIYYELLCVWNTIMARWFLICQFKCYTSNWNTQGMSLAHIWQHYFDQFHLHHYSDCLTKLYVYCHYCSYYSNLCYWSEGTVPLCYLLDQSFRCN